MNYYPAARPTTFGMLPDGPAGIRQTMKIMVSLVRQWKKDPGVRELATQLVRDLPQGDTTAEVRALHAFVRDHIRYTNDTRNVETIQTPRATLELGVGDCDDKSTLLASLLESIGRPTRFVALAFGTPARYSHVLVETMLGSNRQWYPLETIKPVVAGWAPANVTKKLILHN
jgi:transglutaminase-like putative cysteine protease